MIEIMTLSARKKFPQTKKTGFIIDINYSREEVPGTAMQR
jgi:hypothetical protein